MVPKAITLAGVAVLSITPLSLAQSSQSNCTAVQNFQTYNGTKVYPIPGLRITGSRNATNYGLAEDSSPWYLTGRVNTFPAERDGVFNNLWLNVGNASTNDIGMCIETTSTHSLGTYMFSRSVLERSVNDNGDCKTMLGDKCVEALTRHFKVAGQNQMAAGSCTRPVANSTLPYECRDLVNGNDMWNGGIVRFGLNLQRQQPYDQAFVQQNNCSSAVQPLNASMHPAGGIGGAYNQTIRFPEPFFTTFWPNASGRAFGEDNVHVQINCIRPDEMRQGSTVPPSVKELLDRQDVKYAVNATDRKSAAAPAAGMKVLTPYFSAAVIAAILLA